MHGLQGGKPEGTNPVELVAHFVCPPCEYMEILGNTWEDRDYHEFGISTDAP